MTGVGLKKDWVPFPRHIFTDRKSGAMTRNEYELYTFLRHGATPFGIAPVSLEGLLSDFDHHGWKNKNYINKLLLSLKSKGYIYYDDRSGRRGSFDIRLPEFFTPTGGTTRLPDDVPVPKKKRSVSTSTVTMSEARPSFTLVSPRLDVKRDGEIRSIGEHLLSKGRGSYTDTYTDKENNRSLKRNLDIAPSSFNPTSYEEGVCKEIALELGEASMGFLLGTLRTHGFSVIEGPWGVYRHDMPDKTKMRNKRAYFNKMVTQRIEDLAKGKKV